MSWQMWVEAGGAAVLIIFGAGYLVMAIAHWLKRS